MSSRQHCTKLISAPYKSAGESNDFDDGIKNRCIEYPIPIKILFNL